MSESSKQGDTEEIPISSGGGVVAELSEMRGWLIGLATLAASVTYQAGLNPPGGFWQDDNNAHQAGNPVLYDRVPKRYLTFYYFNATAFVTSLVIIILLLNKRFHESETKLAALILTTTVDLMSLVGAYVAGSTRVIHDSIYIIVLSCFLFGFIVYMARVLPKLCFLLSRVPPLFKLAEKGCLPVTDNMKKSVEEANNEKRKAADIGSKTRRNPRCCCCCCCSCGGASVQARN